MSLVFSFFGYLFLQKQGAVSLACQSGMTTYHSSTVGLQFCVPRSYGSVHEAATKVNVATGAIEAYSISFEKVRTPVFSYSIGDFALGADYGSGVVPEKGCIEQEKSDAELFACFPSDVRFLERVKLGGMSALFFRVGSPSLRIYTVRSPWKESDYTHFTAVLSDDADIFSPIVIDSLLFYE